MAVATPRHIPYHLAFIPHPPQITSPKVPTLPVSCVSCLWTNTWRFLCSCGGPVCCLVSSSPSTGEQPRARDSPSTSSFQSKPSATSCLSSACLLIAEKTSEGLVDRSSLHIRPSSSPHTSPEVDDIALSGPAHPRNQCCWPVRRTRADRANTRASQHVSTPATVVVPADDKMLHMRS